MRLFHRLKPAATYKSAYGYLLIRTGSRRLQPALRQPISQASACAPLAHFAERFNLLVLG